MSVDIWWLPLTGAIGIGVGIALTLVTAAFLITPPMDDHQLDQHRKDAA